MPKEPELKARDKVVVRMTREGAVEENLTAGTEQRVSKRLEDAELVKPGETVEPSEALSPEEQKKVQMRRQQRQFQAEHTEDNDTMGVQIHSVQPNTTTCTTAYPQYNLVSFLKLLPSNIPMIDCLSTVFFHYQNTVHHICPLDDKFLRILFHDSANKKQLLSKPP